MGWSRFTGDRTGRSRERGGAWNAIEESRRPKAVDGTPLPWADLVIEIEAARAQAQQGAAIAEQEIAALLP